MDVIERLSLEAAQADTMLACEHRHRYEFAARLCAGRRVLDLCCGSGYGTAILGAHARAVVGVDNDAATVETARATLGTPAANVSFELADAVACLRTDLAARFDVVVCFEGLEHLRDLDRALELLRGHAEQGIQIVASIPNGKLFAERNPFHVTEFGYDDAIRAFAPFASTVMVPQFLAEGSLIVPAHAHETEVTVSLDDRDEPEYANHFVFCVNFDSSAVEDVHHGRIGLNTAPVFNRWAEDLKQGAWALRRENARLARARLGKGGSAAAAALAGLADREAEVAGLRARLRVAEARVLELDAALAGVDAPPEPWPEIGEPTVVVSEPAPATVPEVPAGLEAGEDPNSWEQRRRRAVEFVIPWVEQTVPLAGRTVLEYGCGNAAVSCAFAERAQRLIGVDIDAGWIELGHEELRRHGVTNVELELHPLDAVTEAVAARRGEIDVFLCYAVLEHLTIPERLALLRLARHVVKPDGAIVVCEAPNRLIYFDHHTAQMPFFHLLPDELALEYYPRSARADFTAAIDGAGQHGREAALEAIVRWGRGVSFHEFEVVFGDLSRHVIASNYDPILFPERPIHPDEVILARFLQRWRPDLAPVWSRYWLDLILSPRPVDKRPPFLRPWTAETIGATNVGWTEWENLLLAGPAASLPVRLPQPTSRLVIGCVTSDFTPVDLLLHVDGAEAPLIDSVHAAPQHTVFRSFDLPVAAQRLTLEVSRECHVVFVGYED